ncbi:multiple ankyrin repeats single kh domain, partial [Moniliophthora roreri]
FFLRFPLTPNAEPASLHSKLAFAHVFDSSLVQTQCSRNPHSGLQLSKVRDLLSLVQGCSIDGMYRPAINEHVILMVQLVFVHLFILMTGYHHRSKRGKLASNYLRPQPKHPNLHFDFLVYSRRSPLLAADSPRMFRPTLVIWSNVSWSILYECPRFRVLTLTDTREFTRGVDTDEPARNAGTRCSRTFEKHLEAAIRNRSNLRRCKWQATGSTLSECSPEYYIQILRPFDSRHATCWNTNRVLRDVISDTWIQAFSSCFKTSPRTDEFRRNSQGFNLLSSVV